MSQHVLKYQPKNNENTHSFCMATFPENFPSSDMLNNEEFAEESEKLSKFQLYGQKDKRILRFENDNFEYIGKNFGENSEKNQENRYFLGIASNNKKRMKLYDIDHIFNMKQIKKIKQETEENINLTQFNNSKLNPLEQKQMLVAEFGTRKSKKKLQQMLNNVVEEKNISSAAEIQNVLSEKALDLERMKSGQEDRNKNEELRSKRAFLPEFNLNALKPQLIYDIHSIITIEEWNEINIKFALKIIKNEASPSRELKYYSDFVYEKLVKFNEIFDKKNTKKTVNVTFKLKTLIYLDFLIKVFRFRSYNKPLDVISKELNIKPVFVQNILNKFYQITQNPDNNSFKYQRANDDKMICYIIILCLFFYDFKMDAFALCQILKIDKKKFVLYCKEIGCSAVSKESNEGGSITVELKAPLKLLIESIDEPKLKRKKKN